MRKHYLFVLVMALASMIGKIQAQGDPAYCVPEGNSNLLSVSNGLKDLGFLSGEKVRYIETVTVSGAKYNGAPVGDFVVNVDEGPDRDPVVYYDRTSNVLNVTRGDELTIKWTKSPNYTWMHYYAFIDYDQNGVFEDLTKPSNSEVVSWTFYSSPEKETGTNSKGASVKSGDVFLEMPSFVIPKDAKLGRTRLRFKVDWNSKNPCENEAPNNYLYVQAGTIVDFTVNIVEAPTFCNIQFNTPDSGGDMTVTKSDLTPIKSNSDLTSDTKVKITVSPLEGYKIKSFTINDKDALELLTADGAAYTTTLEMTENKVVNVEFAKKTFAVTFNSPLAEVGTLTLHDETGNVDLTSGALVEYGSDILITAKAIAPATLKSLKIDNVERITDLVDNKLVVKKLTAALDVKVEFSSPVDPGALVYCTPEGIFNTISTTTLTNAAYLSRHIKTITVTGANFSGSPVNYSMDVDPGETRTPVVHFDKTANVLNATLGDKLVIKWTKSESLTWMHYYVFIDYNQDGVFDPSEAVAWTYYQGKNSKGASLSDGDDKFEMPEFTIPTTATLGKTRIRFKVDWDSKNPCENEAPNNYLYKNAGEIIDFTINIAKVKVPVVTITQPTGGMLTLAKENGDAVNSGDAITSGSKLTVTATPENGKHLKCLLINDEPRYENMDKVTVTDDMTISAVFTSDWYIKHNAVENGQVTIFNDGSPVANGADLAPGTEVSVTILPSAGYEIKTLTINNEDASELFVPENLYTSKLTMTKNQVINVVFAKKKFAVTFATSSSEIGTLTVRNVTGSTNLTTGALVEYGSEILITVKASAIATLKSLKIDNVERMQDLVDNKLTLELKSVLNIEVEFLATEYTLSWSVLGNGTVKAFNTNRDDKEVMSGDKVVKSHYLYLEITPEEGYEVSSIKKNDVEVDITEENTDLQVEEGYWIYWFEMTEDLTFNVTFINPVGLTNNQDDLLISYDMQSATLTLSEDVKASIVDLSGKIVRNITEPTTSLNELPNGIYFVKAATMNQQKAIKIVKK